MARRLFTEAGESFTDSQLRQKIDQLLDETRLIISETHFVAAETRAIVDESRRNLHKNGPGK